MINIDPLGDDHFVGKITDDLASADEADLRRISMELVERGVLVASAQQIDPGGIERLAQALGVVETVFPAEHRIPGYPHLRLQSSVPGVGVNGGGMYWHADGSWMAKPLAATLLACDRAPRAGGTTSFVDARALYRTLDADLADRVDGVNGIYPNERTMQHELEEMGIDDPEMLATARDAVHPLVRRHPVSQEEALILNEQWLTRIADLDSDAGCSLLARLSDAAERTTHRYEHAWTRGDVLLWDNRSVLHRANPLPESETKVTWRATLRSLYAEGAGS